jgi:heme o synthase
MTESTDIVDTRPHGLKAAWGIYAEITKLRLTLLVLFSSMIGYLFGQNSHPFPWLTFVNMLLGTYAVASGAAALNQLLEMQPDSRMERTKDRPLPTQRWEKRDAFALGVFLSGGGLAYLTVGVNPISALVAALTLVIYIAIYTPLKRLTTWNTLIGAIPGALPPLIGWSAARSDWTWDAWALFGILFFWQMPHFLAIAWLYREDYNKGGFKMLTLTDATGHNTARKSCFYASLLIPVSLIPYFTGSAGWIYLVGACIFGSSYLGCAVRCVRQPDRMHTKTLFLSSLLYLPSVLILLILNKR